jgi:hypothetical protein
MAFINFDAPDPAGGNRNVKEAVNTDYAVRVYYNGSTSDPGVHITYAGESSTNVKGSVAMEILKYFQGLPNFIEAPNAQKASPTAIVLFNLNHATHLFYREKDTSKEGKDGEALLRIDYGLSTEITDRRPSDLPRAGGLTESSKSFVLEGDEAEATWKKYRGTAL